MSQINTKLAAQAVNALDAKSCADALEYYVTTPPALAADASVWFAGVRSAAGGPTTSANIALDSVQLAAEDTAAVIALTAGELSMAEHMNEVLKVQMRKEIAQGNLDQDSVYAIYRGDANFSN